MMAGDRKHAVLSASGASRWLACPPSVMLEKDFPDKDSEYAAEGTFAHSYAELCLRFGLHIITADEYQVQLSKLQTNQYFSESLHDYICEYVVMVLEHYAEAKARSSDALIMLEQRLDFSDWVPEGFGTGDVVIISDDVMEIIDLKYGKGVPVEAEGNAQLRLYALGALAAFGNLYDIQSVKMTICQPRLNNVSSAELVVEDLLDWANTEVKPKAALALNGEGTFYAGSHCKFCKAKAVCRARAEANLMLARYEFQKPAMLSVDDIADILGRVVELEAWAKDVQTYAREQAELNGVKFPGWKLVEGRSTRKYSDELAVAQALNTAGYDDAVIYEKVLLGITAMEKAIGKKQFEKILGDYIIKPPGMPTLVPNSDKRPEINSVNAARLDFAS